MEIPGRVADVESLEALYRRPSQRAAAKVFRGLDEASRRLIELCPFALLATAGEDGAVDVSPRGGPPGFIRVLDDHLIAVPDLVGNNRLDSLRNIVVNPHAGLLLVVPGKHDTLRVNGAAALTQDREILDGFTSELRRPKLAVVIRADEVYAHCSKALRRGRLWDPASWDELADAPDLAEIYEAQFDNLRASKLRPELEAIYERDLSSD